MGSNETEFDVLCMWEGIGYAEKGVCARGEGCCGSKGKSRRGVGDSGFAVREDGGGDFEKSGEIDGGSLCEELPEIGGERRSAGRLSNAKGKGRVTVGGYDYDGCGTGASAVGRFVDEAGHDGLSGGAEGAIGA